MSADITIRPLDRDELAARVDRFVAVAQEVPGEYWGAQHFLLDLPKKWDLSLAVWDEDTPVGYAILSCKLDVTAHLHHFMIAAGRRGQGLGAQLLAAAIQRCRDSRCSQMSLKVGSRSLDAQRFYRRHGFDDAGADGDYRVMRRRLA